MSERVLVTGGGGFLGRALVRQLLERGDQVRVFSRRTFPDLEALGVECQAGDLGDAAAVTRACEGVDVVHHVAALAGAWGPPEAFERANVDGTRHVIAGCRAAGVRRLVFTSSPSVISPPDETHHEGADERLPYPTRYLADYPRTKALAEQAVRAANGPELATVSLRPHLLVGPGDPHLVPRVLSQGQARRLRIVGDGKNKVALTHVDNAAWAHVLAQERLRPGSPIAGKVYFITQEEPIELWSWVGDLLEALDLPPIEKRISYRGAFRLGGALEAVWRWLRLSGEPPMTRFVATQLATSHWFDISAARRDLGYAPEERLSMKRLNARLFAYYLEGEGKALLGRT